MEEMKDDELIKKLRFETFYSSKEESNSPLIPDIVQFIKQMDEQDIADKDKILISLRYGRRMLSHTKKLDTEELNREEFVEIVDYDPARKALLTIGPKEPEVETPIHWIIQNAKKDINAVVQITDEKLVEKYLKKLPEVEKNIYKTLEISKEILTHLREKPGVLINKQSVMLAGKSLDEIKNRIFERKK
ncbi:MAG: hypothetical protein V5A64_05565 [Candidatus Thermoplasmatota archaeon]